MAAGKIRTSTRNEKPLEQKHGHAQAHTCHKRLSPCTSNWSMDSPCVCKPGQTQQIKHEKSALRSLRHPSYFCHDNSQPLQERKRNIRQSASNNAMPSSISTEGAASGSTRASRTSASFLVRLASAKPADLFKLNPCVAMACPPPKPV